MHIGSKSVLASVAGIVLLGFSIAAACQESTKRNRNNPYSPSPVVVSQFASPDKTGGSVSTGRVVVSVPQAAERPTSPTTDSSVIVNTVKTAPAASSLYKVGVGDVLNITIKYAGAGQTTSFYTVRSDGTIELPFAGGMNRASGRTTTELRDALIGSIKLFAGSQIEVRVHEYNSHKVTLIGLVQNPGRISLQREAMPLFAIKAQAGVDANATRVVLTRSGGTKAEVFELDSAGTDNVLITEGDKVEFVGNSD